MKKISLVLCGLVLMGMCACASKAKKEEVKEEKAPKTLVAYFSATGTTQHIAAMISEVTGGELFAICPEQPYTPEDLDWTNEKSRSTIEMNDPTSRPAMTDMKADLNDYDVVFIGFPIWWDKAPTIINTFIEHYNLADKKICVFATSGSSEITNAYSELKKAYPALQWVDAKLLNKATVEDVKAWLNK